MRTPKSSNIKLIREFLARSHKYRNTMSVCSCKMRSPQAGIMLDEFLAEKLTATNFFMTNENCLIGSSAAAKGFYDVDTADRKCLQAVGYQIRFCNVAGAGTGVDFMCLHMFY